MEEAFFWFEVEIVKLRYPKDVVDCELVISNIGMSGDTDVIHIDANGSAERFVFEDDVAIYEVHHSLEGRWRIGESEVHDCRLKEAVSGFECCLVFVSFADAYVIVPPAHIELCIDVRVAEVADEISNEGKRVLISDRDGVDFSVVLYRSQFTVLFLDEEE